MKKLAFFTGLLTLVLSYAFLYFGSIFPTFETMLLSKIIGIAFEIVIILSSILLIILFKKEKKLYRLLSIGALLLFLIHWLLIITVGFIKPYSFAMDVGVSCIYLLILTNNWKWFLKEE